VTLPGADTGRVTFTSAFESATAYAVMATPGAGFGGGETIRTSSPAAGYFEFQVFDHTGTVKSDLAAFDRAVQFVVYGRQ
jgi:hypothetical protein